MRRSSPSHRPESAAPTARRGGRAAVAATLAALLALSALDASAQGIVTLYGGTRSGGDFVDQNAGGTAVKLGSSAAGSASVDWFLADGRQAQVFTSFQRSSLPGSVAQRAGDIPVNVVYVHLGGRVFFDGPAATAGPYLVGGLGVTHLSPGLDGLTAEVRPSANLGIGFEWPLAPQLSLRGELRGYFTLVNSSGGFFCSGGCVVAIRGDTLSQFEGMLGLSFTFR